MQNRWSLNLVFSSFISNNITLVKTIHKFNVRLSFAFMDSGFQEPPK